MDNPKLFVAFVAAVLIAAWLLLLLHTSRKTVKEYRLKLFKLEQLYAESLRPDPERPRPEPETFEAWKLTLWGVEQEFPAPASFQDNPTVKSDSDSYLLPWVLHTHNRASIRVWEAKRHAQARNGRYPDEQEAAFQRLLKLSRFLMLFTDASLYAVGEDYQRIRPALLALKEAYPLNPAGGQPALDNEPSTPADVVERRISARRADEQPAETGEA